SYCISFYCRSLSYLSSFFFTHIPTTEIYTLSLHDALPISENYDEAGNVIDNGVQKSSNLFKKALNWLNPFAKKEVKKLTNPLNEDRKSTRLNSSHVSISYAVFCLKKKKKKTNKHQEYNNIQ